MINEEFKNLLSPIKIRGLTLKNRVIMMPIGSNMAMSSGEMSDEHIRYYEERAKGGSAMLTLENVCVEYPRGANGATQLRIDDDSFVPQLYKLCETVHRHGCKMSVQFNHPGACASGWRLPAGEKAYAPSNVPPMITKGPVPRPMTTEEVYALIKKFGDAAHRAKIAGFDAIELHSGHSYLVHQFLSPIYNKRNDEFGGSPENRSRFARLVLEEIRARVGKDFPIFMRMSYDERHPDGNTPEEMLELIKLCSAEADVINVSSTISTKLQYNMDQGVFPDGWRAWQAKVVRDALGKPVIASGNIRDPRVAEQIVADETADFIGIGRGLIADPEWTKKLYEGREQDIRKCISCNIGCTNHRTFNILPIRCTVNPDIVCGEEYKKLHISKPCKVLVIGAGMGGLEAACTAAEVGCEVVCIEKKDHIGGWVPELGKIPAKFRMKDLEEYMCHRAEGLENLKIITGTEATAELIDAFDPDIIVAATGSEPVLPPIKGLEECIEKGSVGTVKDFIRDIDKYSGDMSGKKVVIAGGGAVGLDIMEHFAGAGADVTVVEMLGDVGRDNDIITKMYMGEFIPAHDVNVMTGTKILEVKTGSFIAEKDGDRVELDYDYGFVSLGLKPVNEIDNLLEKYSKHRLMRIGDCEKPRKLIDAIAEGRNILTLLKAEFI